MTDQPFSPRASRTAVVEPTRPLWGVFTVTRVMILTTLASWLVFARDAHDPLSALTSAVATLAFVFGQGLSTSLLFEALRPHLRVAYRLVAVVGLIALDSFLVYALFSLAGLHLQPAEFAHRFHTVYVPVAFAVSSALLLARRNL